MKRFLSIFTVLLFLCSMAYSQQDVEQSIKERKQIAKLAKTELKAKASKTARKEAKRLKKEGWVVAPGQLPLDKQLDKSYMMYFEYEDSGLPKYIRGEATSIGSIYDAAKMQALELAKTNLAGMIQTEVTQLLESTVGNEQIGAEDAASIAKTVAASKNLIAQKLGRVVPVVECYRKLSNKNYEVSITIAYNTNMAYESAKAVIKKQLEEKGQDLHNQLDKIWEGILK